MTSDEIAHTMIHPATDTEYRLQCARSLRFLRSSPDDSELLAELERFDFRSSPPPNTSTINQNRKRVNP